MDEETVYTMTESIVNARNEDGSFARGLSNLTTDAYADENEVTASGVASSKANDKPLFCDECTCIIS